MNREEKIYLIECLLRDVRGNWADDVTDRVNKSAELCKELGGSFLKLAERCEEFLACKNIDGRFFRDEFPEGYYGLDNFHSLTANLKDKSQEFQDIAEELITYPEYLFNDWSE